MPINYDSEVLYFPEELAQRFHISPEKIEEVVTKSKFN